MRKKLWRNRGAAGEILRARDRRDECPDVRDETELSLIKKSLELHQVRMETEIAAVAVLQRQGQERGLRNCQRAARGGVGSITAGVVRDDDVMRVVPTEKEKTNERLVIGGIERRGAEAAQIEDRVQDSSGRERGAGGLANESAAGRRSHIHLSTTNSGELTTR